MMKRGGVRDRCKLGEGGEKFGDFSWFFCSFVVTQIQADCAWVLRQTGQFIQRQ